MEGLLIALVTMLAFHMGLNTGGTEVASTMAFATLCLSRLLHGFNCRSKESIFRIGLFTNKFIWIAVIIGYLLLIIVLTLRSLMGVFEGAVLNTSQFSYIYILSIIPLIVVQVYKLLFVRVED